MRRKFMLDLFFCVLAVCPLVAQTGALAGAQEERLISPSPATISLDAIPPSSAPLSNPLTQPTLSPGVLYLMELDNKLSQDVASGGGKAFASWFTEDAVTLNNGRPAVYG